MQRKENNDTTQKESNQHIRKNKQLAIIALDKLVPKRDLKSPTKFM